MMQLHIVLLIIILLYNSVTSFGFTTETGAPRLVEYPPREHSDHAVAVGFGETIKLNCRWTGDNDTRVLWFKAASAMLGQASKEKSEIKSDNRTYTVTKGGMRLSVKSTSSAPGLYQCEVTNRRGTVRSHWIHLPEAVFPDLHIKPVSRGRIRQDTNSSLMLKCASVGSVPTVDITWCKCSYYTSMCLNQNCIRKLDGCKPVKNSTRHLVTEEGDLIIGRLKKEDVGLYCCKASNPVTRQSKFVVYARVNVTDSPDLKQPVGIALGKAYPRSETFVSKQIGDPVRLQSIFESKFPILVKWFKDNTLSHIPKSENKSEISFVIADRSQAGTYTAAAEAFDGNRAIRRNVTIRLEVQELPVINVGPTNTYISTNTTGPMEICCCASGTPAPKIIWALNTTKKDSGCPSMQIQFGQCVKLPQEKAGTTLTLTCNATNEAGYQIAEGFVEYTENVPHSYRRPNVKHVKSCVTSKSPGPSSNLPFIFISLLLPCLWLYR